MQEHTFYSNGNVAVTSARFMVGGETYAMNSIASVRAVKDDPERDWGCLGWVVVLGIGLIFLLGLTGSDILGIIGIILAALAVVGVLYMIITEKPTYKVVLRTSAGDAPVLESKNEMFVKEVVSAINQAMVHRG